MSRQPYIYILTASEGNKRGEKNTAATQRQQLREQQQQFNVHVFVCVGQQEHIKTIEHSWSCFFFLPYTPREYVYEWVYCCITQEGKGENRLKFEV